MFMISPVRLHSSPSRDQLSTDWHRSAKPGRGPPPETGREPSNRVGQISWPPAGSYLAVCGQFLVAVVSRCRCYCSDGFLDRQGWWEGERSGGERAFAGDTGEGQLWRAPPAWLRFGG